MVTLLAGTEKGHKEKNESMDLDARARMTFAATTDINESEKATLPNEEIVPQSCAKNYSQTFLSLDRSGNTTWGQPKMIILNNGAS